MNCLYDLSGSPHLSRPTRPPATPAAGRPATRLLARTALLMGVTLLSACGSDPGRASTTEAPGALGFVVGAHANAPRPQLVRATEDELRNAARRGAHSAVVVNGGTPQVVLNASLGGDARNDIARRQQSEKAAVSVAQQMVNSRASTSEADLLAALEHAARSIADVDGPKTLVVVDSGLQTAGALRFQEPGMLAADPREIADFVADARALPDLRGMRVVFSGLGDTAPPQASLTPAQRRNLVDVWRQIATRAGASSVEVVDAPLSSPSAPGLPAVTVVKVPTPPTPVLRNAASLALGEESVAFRPDSAEYRDRAAAVQSLRPVAQQLLETRQSVELVGTTSSAGTTQGRQRLSHLRAEAVKATLVEMGVPADTITSTGVGSNWPGYRPDRDSQGTLLPGQAARNRNVIVRPVARPSA